MIYILMCEAWGLYSYSTVVCAVYTTASAAEEARKKSQESYFTSDIRYFVEVMEVTE
jgi:hypothetical protein